VHHQNGKVSFNGWSWKCFLTDIPWQWCFAEIATAITLGTTTAIISLHELHFPGLQIWRSVGAATAINHVASCTFPECRFIKVSTPSIDLKISCLLNKELCYMYRFFVLVYWQKNWPMLVSKDKLCDHDLVVITYISMYSFALVYYRCYSWKTNFVTTILWWSHTYPWILLYCLYCSSNVQRQNIWPPSHISASWHCFCILTVVSKSFISFLRLRRKLNNNTSSTLEHSIVLSSSSKTQTKNWQELSVIITSKSQSVIKASDHEGFFVCKLDAQCTWRYLCLQAWCSMHMKVHFVCKLNVQYTSMRVTFHLQAWCSMHIDECSLSFASSMLNVHPWR
jgi:hypothetical protein